MAALAAGMASHSGGALRADESRTAAQRNSLGETAPPMMRPVPKFGGTSVRDPQRTGQASHSGKASPSTHGLQWRTSSEVAPPVTQSMAPRPVQQVQFQTPHSPQTQQLPSPQLLPDAPQLPISIQPELQMPQGLQTPPAAEQPLPGFFDDPFGETTPTPGTPDTPPTETLPPPLMLPPAQPPQLENGLRDPAQPAQPVPLFPEPEESPFDLRPLPTPGLDDVVPRREIEDVELPRRDDRRPAAPVDPAEDITLIRPVAFSCDDFRRSIAEATIQRLSLDISPPFRPDVIELDEFQKLKERFNERQEIREWQSIDGRKLGRGRMRDLAYEKVVIETEFGTLEELPVNRLGEADLAYVSSQWGLPEECLIEQPPYQTRTWLASQITWKASNLIHKPLYFEEVNLERYGHTAGPFLQPVVSSAHFFVNIAVMPYKMGVHSPHECQYALGYYRPGNCAPWITPPVPLSLRGALFQAAAMTGNGLLIP